MISDQLTLPILEAPASALPLAADTSVSDELPADPAAAPVRYVTLGCKVNQYETEYARALLSANGYRDAVGSEPAALAVVNTCTVTAESDRKSRQQIRQLARQNPDAKIIVMGCYATADPVTVARLPNVAAVITDKHDLAKALRPFGVSRDPQSIRRFAGRHRAFVKVQDGCILNCTYCIIPKVRPGLHSRPADEIVAEVRGLVEAGYREIVLSGIHLGHYGVDLSRNRPREQWCRLWHLLDRLARLPGDFRLRLSSLEATEVTADFVGVLAAHPEKICPSLHLSLQSGSDGVLQRMKRRYRIERFIDRCDELRAALAEPAFTTDIIVGFPGETEAEFAETVAAARRIGFSKIHIFPFSARKGTEAEHLPDQLPPPVIQERRERLAVVERELADAYYRRLLGRRLTMLVETPDPSDSTVMRGTSCRYTPMRLRTLPSLAGELVPVRATAVADGALLAEPWVE